MYLSAPSASNLAVLRSAGAKTTAATAALSAALNSPDTMNNATPAEKAGHRRPLLADAAGCGAARPGALADHQQSSGRYDAYNALMSDAYSALDQAILEQTDARW